jgi:hypothetical protein
MKHRWTVFSNARLSTVFGRSYFYLLALCAALPMVVPVCPAQTADQSAQSAVDFADRFLRSEARGRETLSYVHFGADYRSHSYLRTVSVLDGNDRPVPGHFALVYRFYWEKDGVTDVGYLCNERGYVYKVQIMYTNAVLSPPFALANATIQLLGNALIEADKDKMSDLERKIVEKLVSDADAKALLEWSLRFEQASSKF